MKTYLFAKFLQHFTVDELMTTIASLGIDGPTALIREGYWTDPADLSSVCPFVKKAEEYGLSVKYADTPCSPFDESADRTFGVLAENGIVLARLAYIEKKSEADPRLLEDKAKRYAEAAAKLAEKHGIRAVIQCHGMMYPHNATAAYPLVRDLDPRYIGIKIDPGNNLQQEGYELFDYQIRLLREYIAAVGAKSGAMFRTGDPKGRMNGWVRVNVPAQDGAADYNVIYCELAAQELDVPSILMPFYHEKETGLLLEGLRGEVSYLKDCAEKAGL